jgi:thiamine transport system substrate-binding protein
MKPTNSQVRRLATLAAAVAFAVATLACAAQEPAKLVVLTHDSFAISDETLARFETTYGVDVEIVKGGDAGEVVNQAILTKDAPLADVLYGVDNTFLSRALDAGIFDAYAAPAAADLSPDLVADTRGLVNPIDYGQVCVNVDKEAVADGLPMPTTLQSLTEPVYAGKLVVENPATSSPGLAFLMATIGHFGEGDSYGISWQEFWSALVHNDVLVVNDWDTAYYTSFSGGAGEGDRPLVVSYSTSPVAEVVFSDPPVAEPSTSVLTEACFLQIEYAGVLHGTKSPDGARKFIDFMLSHDFQSDIPLNMFVFPVDLDTPVPEVFTAHAAVPMNVVSIDAETIEANRESWIEEWTNLVLR